MLLPAFVLAACAGAVQVGPPAADPTPVVIGGTTGDVPDNTIVVYRAASFGPVTNALTNPALVFEGAARGTCRVGAPLVLRVPDGGWTVEAVTGSGSTNAVVNVAGGETRYLRCGTEAAPSLGPRPVLAPVPVETGSREAGL